MARSCRFNCHQKSEKSKNWAKKCQKTAKWPLRKGEKSDFFFHFLTLTFFKNAKNCIFSGGKKKLIWGKKCCFWANLPEFDPDFAEIDPKFLKIDSISGENVVPILAFELAIPACVQNLPKLGTPIWRCMSTQKRHISFPSEPRFLYSQIT